MAGGVGMSGTIGGGHDGGVAMVMRVEHAQSPLCRTPVEETCGGMGRWEERRSAVLPVAVGHGILSLLLLEELCDGQQLFQHMLQRGKQEC